MESLKTTSPSSAFVTEKSEGQRGVVCLGWGPTAGAGRVQTRAQAFCANHSSSCFNRAGRPSSFWQLPDPHPHPWPQKLPSMGRDDIKLVPAGGLNCHRHFLPTTSSGAHDSRGSLGRLDSPPADGPTGHRLQGGEGAHCLFFLALAPRMWPGHRYSLHCKKTSEKR